MKKKKQKSYEVNIQIKLSGWMTIHAQSEKQAIRKAIKLAEDDNSNLRWVESECKPLLIQANEE